jgi:hypothetical protein
MRQIALMVVAFLLFSSPAGAAAPTDLGTLSIGQRATVLPPETAVVFRGKTTTLGALRKAHEALVAHFAAAGALKIHMPPLERVTALGSAMGAERAHPTLGSPVATGTTSTPTPKPAPTQSASTSLITMFPNAAPAPQPIDYQAACSVFTLCVYIPPVQPDEVYLTTGDHLYVLDPIMSPEVCAQDGGAMFQILQACQFAYMTSASVSVFPGNPPDLRSATFCLNDAFTTVVDPKGAAAITGNASAIFQAIGPNAMICAIDLGVPS